MKSKKVTSPHIITFIKQLSLVLDSDLPVHQGLDIMIAKAENVKMKALTLDLQERMKSGESISDALKSHEDYLSPFVIQMIKLGEESGNLVYALNEIERALEKNNEISDKIKGALTYPSVLFLLMIGVMGLLIVKILPTFEEILESLGGELPKLTLILLNIGQGISNYILWIFGVLILMILGFNVLNKTSKGKYFFHKLMFKIPFVKSVFSALMGYKLSSNLYILLKSGVSPSLAFDMIKPLMNNLYFEDLMTKGKEKLKEGESMSEVLSEFEVFPGVMMPLFAVAQETGHTEVMLNKIAILMDEVSQKQLNRITNIVEPVLMIILSLLMAVILISAVLPVIEILNGIG